MSSGDFDGFALYDAMNAQRVWRALARELSCSDHQLTGIKSARYAIAMTLAMRIVTWLGRPAADFIFSATW
jgi:hypothetical protein